MEPNTKQYRFKEKLLIISGDAAFGEKLQKLLNDSGYQTMFVKNGVEGLKTIYSVMPHLILLDIVVPGIEGYDILVQKQAEPMLAKIPLFLMSNQGVPINMRRVPDGSVAEFIVALHGEPRYILERIDRFLGHERELDENTAGAIGDQKKVVWAEDDKLIGSILEKKFISSGFDLIHAKNGDETLESLKHVIPDAIVLDLLLPGMSGFDILQKIKADSVLSKVPVIILSNLSKPSDIERAKILGANKFLVKAAVSLDQIVAEVREVCK